MKNLTLYCLASMLCLLFAQPNASAQRAWRVSQSNTAAADFTSLATAVSSAGYGDTLYVESGNYGNVSLNNKLIIYGVGIRPIEYDTASISSIPFSVATLILFDSASGSRLEGLTINTLTLPGVNPGVVISDVVIKRCEITSELSFTNFGGGAFRPLNLTNILITACILNSANIGGTAGSFLNGIILTNSIINGSVSVPTTTIGSNDNTGVIFANNVMKGPISTNHAIVQNNIITYLSGANYQIGGSNNSFSNNIWTANTVSNAAGQTNNQFNGANVYGASQTDIFVGTVQGVNNLNNHTLKVGSPAIGAGINGIDCGIFGGATPAVIPPLPTIPSIYFLEVDAIPTNNQLGIRIKARSGN